MALYEGVIHTCVWFCSAVTSHDQLLPMDLNEHVTQLPVTAAADVIGASDAHQQVSNVAAQMSKYRQHFKYSYMYTHTSYTHLVEPFKISLTALLGRHNSS